MKAGEAGISKNIDPKNKVITYRVTKGPQGWKLIDPPMPIVGLKSLTEFYMAELQTSSRAMAALEGKGIRQYANLTKVRDIAAMRLHDLEALGKVK